MVFIFIIQQSSYRAAFRERISVKARSNRCGLNIHCVASLQVTLSNRTKSAAIECLSARRLADGGALLDGEQKRQRRG
jgi:hypothetical protein